jgi:hypothetical protein
MRPDRQSRSDELDLVATVNRPEANAAATKQCEGSNICTAGRIRRAGCLSKKPMGSKFKLCREDLRSRSPRLTEWHTSCRKPAAAACIDNMRTRSSSVGTKPAANVRFRKPWR